MGNLRETLKTVKGRKSFNSCHLIMKTHFSSSFAATWVCCLFHLIKNIFQRGRINLFLKQKLCNISCYKLTTLWSHLQICRSRPGPAIEADEVDLLHEFKLSYVNALFLWEVWLFFSVL